LDKAATVKTTLTLLISFLIFFAEISEAQKHDNNWLWGRQLHFQDSSQYYAGNAQGNFDNDSLYAFGKFRNMPFVDCAAYYSDEEGNLLFYTNGMQIRDTTGNLLQNGDSINFGWQWMQNYQAMVDGNYAYPFPRTALFIKHPTNDSVVLLIHENVGDTSSYQSRLNLTLIKRRASGSFSVVKKNYLLSNHPVALSTLAACKHGNGRDWWILFAENNTNCIVELLLTPDSIMEYGTQCIGDTLSDGNGIKGTFSLDGTKYANSDTRIHGTNIFDFDRCSGHLSNPQHIKALLKIDTINGSLIATDHVINIELSPDGRLLYIMQHYKIYQFDLNSVQFPNDYDSIVLNSYIDTAIGITWPLSIFSSLYGPDGILYITPGATQRYLHTINNPNGKGVLCDFREQSKLLPKIWSYTAPNIPNYRLGRWLGSACDTVYNGINPIYNQAASLRVYPNPATDEVNCDYNWIEWEKYKTVKCRVINVAGQRVSELELPRYSSKQVINVKQLAQGIYTVEIVGDKKQLAVAKMVKQ
jgi:hypothetical protein